MWIAAQYCTLDLLETTKVSQGRDVRKICHARRQRQGPVGSGTHYQGRRQGGIPGKKGVGSRKKRTVAISAGIFS